MLDITNNAENAPRDEMYFVAPAPYLGNKQSSYSQTFSFTLGMDIPLPDGWNDTVNGTFTVDYLTQTGGDVIIKGVNTDFKLVATLANLPAANRTSYSVCHGDYIDGIVQDCDNSGKLTLNG